MSTRLRRFGIQAVVCVALATSALAASGCFNPFSPRLAAGGAPPTPPPAPTTAAGVLRLFQWCWRNRAITEYREIFTDDYLFKFSVRDSSGSTYDPTVRPWRREDELDSAEKLFVTGTPSDPPATNITFEYTSDLVAVPDARPGKDPGWHKQIRAQVSLRIIVGESTTEVTGPGLFYLVRGDSAAIPQELVDRGFKPDANRWWIERWEDETTPPNEAAQSVMRPAPGTNRVVTTNRAATTRGAADLPAGMMWGQLKAWFR